MVGFELSCIGSQSAYSRWLVFIFSWKVRSQGLEMERKLLLQQNDAAAHTTTLDSAGLNGNPAAKSFAV